MSNAYDFCFTSIDGEPLPLSSFKGKPVLVVNVASRCGLTPQYEGMEALYRDYRDKGLIVLGVPCNQFAGQEPGTEAEIKDFCQTKFDVDFPMTSKVDVKDDAPPPVLRLGRGQARHARGAGVELPQDPGRQGRRSARRVRPAHAAAGPGDRRGGEEAL